VDPGIDHNAAFSPDENEVVWEGHRGQNLSVFRRRSDGSDDARLVRRWDRGGGPDDWSPDGKFVVYTSREIKTQSDLWVLPMQDKTEPFPLVATEFNESDGRISPDGRWLAYVSNATGRNEVYLQRLDGSRLAGGPQRVSSNGGIEPTWRRDGTELFYVSNGSLTVVKIALETERPAGAPQTLFPMAEATGLNFYAASPDGQRFLVIEGVRETTNSAVILMNWKSGLKK
jgi:Tol biopolymer transport system component